MVLKRIDSRRLIQSPLPVVVQLLATAISENSYETSKKTVSSTVLRGILLEYHPNITVKGALQSELDQPWRQWVLQTSIAHNYLHLSSTSVNYMSGNMLKDI
jgi:hypothetical protein